MNPKDLLLPGLGLHQHSKLYFTWVTGFELRSSRLQSKCFIDWAVLQALQLDCLVDTSQVFLEASLLIITHFYIFLKSMHITEDSAGSFNSTLKHFNMYCIYKFNLCFMIIFFFLSSFPFSSSHPFPSSWGIIYRQGNGRLEHLVSSDNCTQLCMAYFSQIHGECGHDLRSPKPPVPPPRLLVSSLMKSDAFLMF